MFIAVLRSFDGLDTPLHAVTFCVVDLETTGGSPGTCAITEIGAARYRGGERLGTFQTLVDPGAPIAPAVAALTGITDALVRAAPPLGAVLPALVEFVGGAVLVGHNLRFDVSFLDAALARDERGAVGLHRIDTVALARRLVADEVPDCRLGTLAVHLRLAHRPTHRALDDALATADLLHALLERAAGLGVTVLDDLLALPHLAAHPQRAKLRLTNGLPRAPGVYVLRDGQGRALEVGCATDLRREVRALFSTDRPARSAVRLPAARLRAVQSIDHVACRSSLEAAVVEVRLAHDLDLRRGGPGGRRPLGHYVKVGSGPSSRLTVARVCRGDGARYLGPLPSAADARAVVDAVRLLAGPGGDPAAAARALLDDPAPVLSPQHRRMVALHDSGHHARAEAVRVAGATVAGAVRRHRALASLRRAGRVVLDLPAGRVELHRGRLAGAWPDGGPDAGALRCDGPADAGGPPADDGPVPLDLADELACVATWLDAHAGVVRLVHADGELSSELPALPGFAPGARAGADRHADAAGLRCAAC